VDDPDFKLLNIMNLFYAPDIKEGFYHMPGEESRHILKVLRMKTGDSIFLTDGLGNLTEASIVDASSKQCTVKTLTTIREYQKRPFHLHIAIAPTKQIDRFEWFLEKSTEIGIDVITPLICNHSERTHVKTDRLQKVVVAAMKQSLKAYLPKLDDPAEFGQFIKRAFEGQKFIAYCRQNDTVQLKNIYLKSAKALVLIGPEGDFSVPEVELAKNQGFMPISLGKSRLRTETAGIVACHTINLVNSD
jgi:16S rRNA (uracil1498-N3)-methyltransferase